MVNLVLPAVVSWLSAYEDALIVPLFCHALESGASSLMARIPERIGFVVNTVTAY